MSEPTATYEHGLMSEEEQRGLAPLLCGHVGFCVDALPLGTSRTLKDPYKVAKGSTPHPFTGWVKPDGKPWPAEDFRDHLTTYLEDRVGFTPNRTMLAYVASHVLAPYYMRDELVRFIRHHLEPIPGTRTPLEDIYAQWRRMPVRPQKNRSSPPGVSFRTFKAPEAQWREMLAERGYDLSSSALLGWALKGKPVHWTVTKAEGNSKEQVT